MVEPEDIAPLGISRIPFLSTYVSYDPLFELDSKIQSQEVRKQLDHPITSDSASNVCPGALLVRLIDILSVAHHIPFLALPDGAHNYSDDFVYFMLPSPSGMVYTTRRANSIADRPLFGVSCIQVVPSKELVRRR